MKAFKLSHTDVSIPKIALGCWGFAGGSMWGDQEESDSIATVHAALDAGINFFENAHGYGQGYAEEVLGKALEGHRDQAVIATKINIIDDAEKDVAANCELSLKRLRTDYIDLLQLHWPRHHIPSIEVYQAFTKLLEAGKIRAFGVSNYGVGDLSDILQYGNIASNQLPYSLLFRAIEYELQPLCVKADVGIFCYSTLLHGLLAGKYKSPAEVPDGRGRTRHFSKDRSGTRHTEDGCELEMFAAIDKIGQISAEIGKPISLVAVAWVLQQPGVAAAIVGARQPGQIQQMAAAVDLKLSSETLNKLDEVTKPVKYILGTNPDMWVTESRFR
jgi:aryl-alcohol dehydrogenase-like predicted oxidoreductase